MHAPLLRDRSQITRLLVLAELQQDPGATLSQVAQALGITVQAVSTYARDMARRKLLALDGTSYRLTPQGVQALHEGLRGLREAVDGLSSRHAVIHVTSAVATSAVKAGQSVGLVMQDGDLAAVPERAAASRGRALADASAGGEVIVGDLKGLVDLRPGPLVVVSVPGPQEGGVARVDLAALRKLLAARGPARLGAHGTGARILGRQLAKSTGRPLDLEFAADRAAFNAAERGLAVHLLVSRDLLSDLMATLERCNAETLARVPVELVPAPET